MAEALAPSFIMHGSRAAIAGGLTHIGPARYCSPWITRHIAISEQITNPAMTMRLMKSRLRLQGTHRD